MRKAVVVIAIAALVLAIASLYLDSRRKRQYPYNVSYSVLQFGNIDGDKFPDMVTYGYRGQAAGNVYWFVGKGDRFDERCNDPYGQLRGGYGARFVDLDGDGDMDMLSDAGICRNDSGKFVPIRGVGQATPYSDQEAFQELILLIMGNHSGFTFDLFAWDITADNLPEIILLGDREMILGVSRGKMDWEFSLFENLSPPSFDANQGGRLVFLKPPSPELETLLKAESIRYRVPSAPPPKLERSTPTRQNRDEYHWLDLDGDGKVELAVCSALAVTTETRRGQIDILREHTDRFELLSSFLTEPYPTRELRTRVLSRPPFPLFQFVDFDKDGRLDLLCQDRWIYRQGDKFAFTKARKIELSEKGLFPATLYAYDINADGWPDVVSSYQPFWNIALGPLLKWP